MNCKIRLRLALVLVTLFFTSIVSITVVADEENPEHDFNSSQYPSLPDRASSACPERYEGTTTNVTLGPSIEIENSWLERCIVPIYIDLRIQNLGFIEYYYERIDGPFDDNQWNIYIHVDQLRPSGQWSAIGNTSFSNEEYEFLLYDQSESFNYNPTWQLNQSVIDLAGNKLGNWQRLHIFAQHNNAEETYTRYFKDQITYNGTPIFDSVFDSSPIHPWERNYDFNNNEERTIISFRDAFLEYAHSGIENDTSVPLCELVIENLSIPEENSFLFMKGNYATNFSGLYTTHFTEIGFNSVHCHSLWELEIEVNRTVETYSFDRNGSLSFSYPLNAQTNYLSCSAGNSNCWFDEKNIPPLILDGDWTPVAYFEGESIRPSFMYSPFSPYYQISYYLYYCYHIVGVDCDNEEAYHSPITGTLEYQFNVAVV